MNLAELLTQHPAEIPVVPFVAVNGQSLIVTAVLERTAVVCQPGSSDRHVARLETLTVDPAQLLWQPELGVRRSDDGQPDRHLNSRERGRESSKATRSRLFMHRAIVPRSEEERRIIRQRSDERAIADRTRKPVMIRVRGAKPKKPRKVNVSGRLRAVPISHKEAARLRFDGLKRCPECQKTKPLEQFQHSGYCTQCAGVIGKRRYQTKKASHA